MGMGVWDESNDRRSDPPRRSRIRRFTDWKDFALWVGEIAGAATIVAGFVAVLLTSLGFKVSGAGQAITDLARADTAQIHRVDSVKVDIAAMSRRMDRIDSQLGFLAYLGCEQAKKNDPSPVLARACARATTNQDPQ
jgi:hypothetical protein